MNLDDILKRASSSDFSEYDPTAVIEAVNALFPLGKDGALAAIDAFLAKQDLADDPHRGMFLVLRTLFDAESHPPMLLGGSNPTAPSSPTALPRFPIVIIADVPLLLVSGYMLGGMAEQVTDHVVYYRQHGTLRAAPLAPAPAVDRASEYATTYQAAYGAAPTPSERELIAAQLARFGS